MRVLHVITDLGFGGAQAMLSRLVSSHVWQGDAQDVVSLVDGGVHKSPIEAAGVRVASLGMRPGRPSPGALWALRRKLTCTRPDIVVSWLYHADLIATLATMGLAPRPALLLLDEPLSALDRPTQLRLRRELRDLLRRLDVPTVLVTHDRAEALQLGDRLVVMDGGRVCQEGEIQRVFDRPTDPAVARILGVETVVLGRVVEVSGGLATVAVGEARLHAPDPGSLGVRAYVCIRGEDVLVERGEPGPSTARNRLPARIAALHSEGPLVRLTLDAGFPLESLVTRQACADLGLAGGEAVTALLKASAIHLIPHD